MDKNQAMIDYLITCPAIKDTPLYFNFVEARNDSTQMITMSSDRTTNKRYIDGTVQKVYTFSLIKFKSMAYNPIVKLPWRKDENVEDMFDVQGLIDWLDAQRNFPDFGENCYIEKLHVTTDTPQLDNVDTTTSPPLVQYSVTVEVQYLDESKSNWN